MPGGGNLVRYERYRKGPRTPRSAHARYYYTRSLVLDPPIRKRPHAGPQRSRCQSAPKVMDSHSRSASPREPMRPQHRPPSPPSSPGAFDNRAYQHDDADPNHNDSFTSSAPHSNGHSKEPNGETKLPEAVNLELINLTPKNGTKKKDVEVDMNTSNPYDEYFVPVNEHRKFMRGEKLYVTADKRGEKSGCKRPLCWTLLVLVVAAIVAIIVLAATGILFASSPTTLEQYNTTVSSARAFGGLGGHDHDHHGHEHHEHGDNNDHSTEPALEHSDSTQNDQPHIPVPGSDENDTSMYVPRTVEGELKIDNQEFSPALEDSDSAEYREFVNSFTDGIKKALFDRNALENGDHDVIVEVIKLTKGSVVVTYRIHWKPKSNTETSQDILNAESLKTNLDNYLANNNRMINVYHVAEDKMPTKLVLNICQIDNNHCDYGCEFDENTLDFTCTCPHGQILDMANQKKCVSILENSYPTGITETEHKDMKTLEIDTSPVTTKTMPEEDESITETVHVIENGNTFDWKPTNDKPLDVSTESDADLHFSHIFTNQDDQNEARTSLSGVEVEAEPTAEPKGEPEPTSEPKAEPEPSAVANDEVEPKSEPEPSVAPEPVAEPGAEPESTAEPKPEPEPKSESEPNAEPGPSTNAEPRPITETQSTGVTTHEPSAEPAAQPAAEPEPDPLLKTEASSDHSSSDHNIYGFEIAPSPTTENAYTNVLHTNIPPYFQSPIKHLTTKTPIFSIYQTYEDDSDHTTHSAEIVTSAIPAEDVDDSNNVQMETTTLRVSISEPNIINEPSYEPKPEIISILSEKKNSDSITKLINDENHEATTEHNEWLQDSSQNSMKNVLHYDKSNINNESEQRSFKTIDAFAEEPTTKQIEEQVMINGSPVESNIENRENVTTFNTAEENADANQDIVKNESDNLSSTTTSKEMSLDGDGNSEATVEPKENKEYFLSEQHQKPEEEKKLVEALEGRTEVKTEDTTEKKVTEENMDITFDTINMFYNRSSKSIENGSKSEVTQPNMMETTAASDWLMEPVAEIKYQDAMNKMQKHDMTEATLTKIDEVMNIGVTKDDFEPDYLNNMSSNNNNNKLSEQDEPMYGMIHDYDSEDSRVKRVNKEKEISNNATVMEGNNQNITMGTNVAESSIETTTIIEYIYKTSEKIMNEPATENDVHVVSLTTTSTEKSEPAPVWEDSEKDLTVKELQRPDDTDEVKTKIISVKEVTMATSTSIMITKNTETSTTSTNEGSPASTEFPIAQTGSSVATVESSSLPLESISTTTIAPSLPIESSTAVTETMTELIGSPSTSSPSATIETSPASIKLDTVLFESSPVSSESSQPITELLPTVSPATPESSPAVVELLSPSTSTRDSSSVDKSSTATESSLVLAEIMPSSSSSSTDGSPISAEAVSSASSTEADLTTISNIQDIPKTNSETETQASNTTQANNLNVTIYEISSHNGNNTFAVHSTNSGEYEDDHHEPEMNPFLPEVENNKSLVKKLQEGHDIEPATFNETQNDNVEEHSNTTTETIHINNSAIITEDEHKVPTMTAPTTTERSLIITNSQQNDADAELTTTNSVEIKTEEKKTIPISDFLLDTDDLDTAKEHTTEYKTTIAENKIEDTVSSLSSASNNEDYLSVVPIDEERLEEKEALKRDYGSENDISDSPKKSDRRTLDETKFESVIANDA